MLPHEVVDTTAVWLAQGLLAAGRGSRVDGWSNTTTGMGTWRDKTRSTFYRGGYDLGPQELDELYSHEDVAGRGVDLVPDECFRPGYRLDFEDDGLLRVFEEERERLSLDEKLIEADCFGRLHGGSLLVLGKDDGQSAGAPLRATADAAVEWLEVLDSRYYSPLSYYTRGPKIGTPELYSVGSPGPHARTGFVLHESRTIPFGGARTTKEQKLRRGWRDHSVLQRPYDVIRKFATGFEAVGQLLTDGPQGVFSVDGLRDLVAVHGTAAIEARVELIDRMRSFVRGIMVDGKGEKFERQQVPFAGIPDVLDRLMLRLASAMEEPMVLLFGMSPSGFSTGDTDMRIWHNRIRARQGTYLSPKIRATSRVLLGLEPGREIKCCWGNLWEPTEKERAETNLSWVQADKLDFDMGVREPEEIFLDREGRPGWEPEEEATEARRASLELTRKAAEEVARAPAENVQQTVLNGAQIASLIQVVNDVAAGTIPRPSGVEILITALGVDKAEAERLMSTAGKGFKPSAPEPPPAPFGAKPGVPGRPGAAQGPGAPAKQSPALRAGDAPPKR